jgi:hypothetical protein
MTRSRSLTIPVVATASSFGVRRPLAPVQWATLIAALVVLVYSVIGLIVNPDFAIGDDATAERVLGVDMNGWHAVSGFAIVTPALLAAPRPRLAAIVALGSAGGLIATAVWAFMSTKIAGGVFFFPNNEADAWFHLGTAAIFLAGALHYFRSA